MASKIEAFSKKYRTPQQVQRLLRSLPYNREKNGVSLRSANSALRKKTVHCFEAAFVAAAILERNGFPPLVMSFESRDGLDHVIFVYRENKKWGSIGRSRDEGLHGRAPVYRSLLDLALSYYEPYVDKTGEITAYQLAHLDDSKADWRESSRNVWKAEKYLLNLRHKKIRRSKERYTRLRSKYLRHGPVTSGKNWW